MGFELKSTWNIDCEGVLGFGGINLNRKNGRWVNVYAYKLFTLLTGCVFRWMDSTLLFERIMNEWGAGILIFFSRLLVCSVLYH